MSDRSKRVIAEGELPGEAKIECVGGRSFSLDRKDTALVIIDMQTDFLTADGRIGKHYKGGNELPTRKAIAGVERLLGACRAAGLTIAHSRSHRYGADVRDDLVGIGDEGYELYPTLRARPGEIVVDKWTFGAFASTPLEVELRARGVERILLCGVLTNVCIFATASQAVDRFLRVCLVKDACAALDDSWHEAAVKLMNGPQARAGHNAQTGLYFAEVASVSDAEAALAPVARAHAAAPASEAPEKRRKVECPAFASVERRSFVSALAKAAAKGADPGDASISCRGNRVFPVANKDTALVIIDMQTDFLSPEGRIGTHYKDTPIRSGLAGVERLLAACRRAGFTIAHSRSHRYGAVVRDDLVDQGDEGYELYPTCKPLPGEIVVDKWTFGAFASTPLEEELRARGVNRILLCGVLTNVCVYATAVQAVDRFIRVCLVHDACGAFDQDWHDTAVRVLEEAQARKGHNSQVGLYFGEVTSVKDVEDALGPLKPREPAAQ